MFFLVTGASGVGKTTVRKILEPQLAGRVATCELATLGLTPEWSLRWRHQAVERAVQVALEHQKAGTHFLLCGDPVPPGELYAAPSAAQLDAIQVCLLDVSPEKQTERLTKRGDPADLLPAHLAFAEWMRHHVQHHRHRPEVIINTGWEQMRWRTWTAPEITKTPWPSHIIDTTKLTAAEVATQVLAWINHHLEATILRKGRN